MSIFAELNRRNVFRVALLYVVAGWLILQLGATTFHHLGIPDWAFRFIFALILICFPLALIFAWVFEITPQGLKRGQNVEAQVSITARTGKRITRITIVLAVVAIITFVYDNLAPATISEKASGKTMDPSEQILSGTGPIPDTSRQNVDLQGHRGARGLLPENTIPAFLHALDLGVTTLEMDTAINAQGHVVVSHEPWMSAKICSHADGRPVTESEEKGLRIYAMSDAEVSSFDCGSRGHPDFEQQSPMPVSKPLLSDVFAAVAAHVKASDRDTRLGQVLYNIEIKSLPEGDGIFHPEVMEFARILYGVVEEYDLIEQTTIQSFDTRALEAIHEIDPEISTSLIVENQLGIEKNLDQLSFMPQIYSPYYKLLDQQQIDTAHASNIRVIPWTINDGKTMRKLLDMGVDGIITDYPDLGVEVLAEIDKER